MYKYLFSIPIKVMIWFLAKKIIENYCIFLEFSFSPFPTGQKASTEVPWKIDADHFWPTDSLVDTNGVQTKLN